MNDHYNTFRYFVEHYMYDLNAGGTFTLIELIGEYKKFLYSINHLMYTPSA